MGSLKSFLDALFYELLHGSWADRTLAIIVLAIALILIGMILWGLFYLLDTCLLPTYQAKGIIDGHSYSPSSMILIGTGGILNPYHIPESWNVRVRVGRRTGWMSVSKSFYDFLQDGHPVVVSFTNRRLTRRMHIKSLS